MKIINIARTVLLATTLLSFSAMAEGLYLIGGVGSSNVTTDETDFDSNSTSFRVGIGKALANKSFAIEGYYIDYGTASDLGIDASGDAIAIQGVGKAHASGNLSLFAKLGFANWSGEAGGESESGSDVYYGLGLENALGATSAVRFEYEFIAMNFPDDIVYVSSFGLQFIVNID